MTPADVSTRYFSEDDGQPLVTAPQAADLAGVQTRTIYQWVRRNHLEVAGLSEDGQQLFNSGDVSATKSTLRPRRSAA